LGLEPISVFEVDGLFICLEPLPVLALPNVHTLLAVPEGVHNWALQLLCCPFNQPVVSVINTVTLDKSQKPPSDKLTELVFLLASEPESEKRRTAFPLATSS
jgi:hypothetical protein